jgi:hypothetical protein
MSKRFAVLIFSCWALACSQSQGQSFSPFSRYGLGYIHTDVMPATRGMGGIATPYSSYSHINHSNPASYADIGITSFEVGANLDLMTVTTSDTGQNTINGGNGSVSHIALGVPLIRGKLGLAFGLLPYSTINYDFTQIAADTVRKFTGKGSLYQFFVGTGYRYKAFSFGVNAGYVFGQMRYNRAFEFTDTTASIVNTRDASTYRVNGLVYNLGVQYHYTLKHRTKQNHLKSDINLVAGIQGSGGIKLNSQNYTQWERYYYGTQVDPVTNLIDTSYRDTLRGKVNMPIDFSAGVLFGNESWWQAGIDFKYTGWSQFSYDLNKNKLGDSWRIKIGGSITPNVDSKQYLAHLQFKAGGYYGKSEIIDQGVHLSEYGGTIGISFPIFINSIYREAASFHVNADLGARTPSVVKQLTENYYRINFGFTLNNVWFIKRKFD